MNNENSILIVPAYHLYISIFTLSLWFVFYFLMSKSPHSSGTSALSVYDVSHLYLLTEISCCYSISLAFFNFSCTYYYAAVCFFWSIACYYLTCRVFYLYLCSCTLLWWQIQQYTSLSRVRSEVLWHSCRTCSNYCSTCNCCRSVIIQCSVSGIWRSWYICRSTCYI